MYLCQLWQYAVILSEELSEKRHKSGSVSHSLIAPVYPNTVKEVLRSRLSLWLRRWRAEEKVACYGQLLLLSSIPGAAEDNSTYAHSRSPPAPSWLLFTHTHTHSCAKTYNTAWKWHFTPWDPFLQTLSEKTNTSESESCLLKTFTHTHACSRTHSPSWNWAQTSSTVSLPICFFLLLWDAAHNCMRM